jgi:hypothetical protein
MEAVENSWRSVGEILVQRGLVSEADLDEAVAEEAETDRRVADILVGRGLVTGHDITNALMEQFTRFSGPNGDAPETSAAAELEPDHEPEAVHESEAEAEFDAEAEAEAHAEPEADVHAEEDDVPAPVASYEERPEVVPTGLEDLPVQPRILIHEADARRLAAESKLAALGHIWQGLEQIHEDLEAHELCTLPFAHELEATQERLTTQGDALSTEIALLKQAREQIESTAQELEHLRTELRGKVHELAELRATASIWNTRVDNQEAEVDALTARADNAAAILSAFAETRLDAPALEAVTRRFGYDDLASHDSAAPRSTDGGYVLLVPREEGTELIECDGGPPDVGETIDVGEESWLVTKIGRSPLPFDERDCVFLAGASDEGR